MLGSVLLYFAARQFGWNLPSYPSGVWYFNPFAWQLLFVLGAWLAFGGANTLHFLVRSRIGSGLRPDVSALCGCHDVGGSTYPSFRQSFPRALFEAFNPNDKTNLAPYRFLHLAILIIVGARLIPIDAPGLQAADLASRWSNAASNRSKYSASGFTFRSLHPFCWRRFPTGFLRNFWLEPAASRS